MASLSLSTLTTLWPQIAASYPPGLIEVTVTILAQILGFWLPCTLYLAIDLAFPAFSSKHKLQSSRRQPTWAAITHCFQRVLTANLLSTVLHVAFAFATNFQHTLFTITSTYPTPRELIADFAYALLLRELLFYTAHRSLHHPKLYTRFHKQHHSFTAPMAFAAQYAHPLEHMLANVMPIVLPLALRRAHILSFALFLTSMLIETASVHSGYDFAGARKHDLHHEKFRVNYGALGLLDWVFGTDVVGWDRKEKKES
ncbi:oxidoreductase [Blastomyces dermatitidis ER-3]|uniref:Oxidoreductase n=2 Tax=Ajellomyces dermatitidis TaxID=5039 RepID=F2TRI3_AJEDA|nr:oxidoreductase [Blastomyces dermatitidis ER-3]EEQ91349.2 oxidoreductase [Blastomyces dermatitidis ER-3]EGE85846.1 oxidoreductase [Blastomyces dermatitidis ATCC 18188]EQL31694.1 oxidoreductase [Blastomyces dermatitidis ATCC 26199]KMW68751.1 oxidoreductase, variant [Blastomyces dermatitidis ATCC 18188]